jgi:hypothetical protein
MDVIELLPNRLFHDTIMAQIFTHNATDESFKDPEASSDNNPFAMAPLLDDGAVL